MDLLIENVTLDKVTVKFCNVVTTGSHNGPNKDICIKCTETKAMHKFEIECWDYCKICKM